MKRIALTIALALIGLIGTTAPAHAWPWSPGTASDCTTHTYTRHIPAGFRTRVVVRNVTFCRNGVGQVISIRVYVTRYTIPR